VPPQFLAREGLTCSLAQAYRVAALQAHRFAVEVMLGLGASAAQPRPRAGHLGAGERSAAPVRPGGWSRSQRLE